jgi:hypothetical protein
MTPGDRTTKARPSTEDRARTCLERQPAMLPVRYSIALVGYLLSGPYW